MRNVQKGFICLLVAASNAIACGGESSGSSQAASAAMVGQSCVPSFEEHSAMEVSVESESPDCGDGVCLVANFQGRVSCPYGQDDAGGGCVTASGESIEGAVAPQLVARPPSDAIYCSCRCDAPEGADVCACPSGFECRPMIADLAFSGSEEYAGSYCVKAGTYIEDPVDLASGPRCDASAGNCEDR